MGHIHHGDARDVAKTLATASVNCIVTSPPYWGLRDYGTGEWSGGEENCDHVEKTTHSASKSTLGPNGNGLPNNSDTNMKHKFSSDCPKCGATRTDAQLGHEPTPDAYAATLVGVFRELRRVLRDDGTLWLNLGDSYASSGAMSAVSNKSTLKEPDSSRNTRLQGCAPTPQGLKPKDLVGIPWLVAFALRADGWYLRSDIIWHKPNPMPESVTDRPTTAHEHVFLLSKQAQYYYDADAIREPHAESSLSRYEYGLKAKIPPNGDTKISGGSLFSSEKLGDYMNKDGKNKRSVWTIPTSPYPDAHFACFPPKLIEPCILAGCPPGGVVLDPFFGSGTTGAVATALGRDYVGIELNADYIALARKRIASAQAPLFAAVGGAWEVTA